MTTTTTQTDARPGSGLVTAADVTVDVQRVPREDVAAARATLERDGAVILTGWPAEAESNVVAAASVLGTRLRELERVEGRSTRDAGPLGLHRDGANVVVDIGDRMVKLRNPDIDFLFILCASPASSGGESVVVDGYRLVDLVAERAPELHRFLATTDVDSTSAVPRDDVHQTPRVHRMVEWTRGGRRIVRTAQFTQPVPREARWDEHQAMIDMYAAVLDDAAAEGGAQTALASGEMLVLDNYRCLHAVRAHPGPRSMFILRTKSDEVR